MQRHKVIHWTRAKTCFCFFVNFRPIQWLMVKCQITFFEVSLLYDISSDLKKVLWVFLRAQNKKKLVRLSKDGATEAAAPKPFPQSLHFTWRWKSWLRQAMIFLNFDFCQKRSLKDFFLHGIVVTVDFFVLSILFLLRWCRKMKIKLSKFWFRLPCFGLRVS